MNKFSFLFGIEFLLMFSCSPIKQPEIHEMQILQKSKIENKEILDLIKEAKWQLYCYQCDVRLHFYSNFNISDSPYASSLDLKFDRIIQKNDTVEVKFKYFYQDTILCDVNSLKNYFDLNYGVAFKENNRDSILYFITDRNIIFSRGKYMDDRYDNVLQTDVISFIKSNKDILNRWFYNEAKNRNIINEH